MTEETVIWYDSVVSMKETVNMVLAVINRKETVNVEGPSSKYIRNSKYGMTQ